MTDEIFDVYVSHSRRNPEWAGALAAAIESGSSGRSRGPWKVAVDRDVPPNDEEKERLLERVERCKTFVAILSRNYLESYQERGIAYEEYGTAVHREFRGGGGVIFHVLAEETELLPIMERKPQRPILDRPADKISTAPEFTALLDDLERTLGHRPTAILERGEIARRETDTPTHLCDLVLLSTTERVRTIRVLRELTGSDLKEAMEIVDGLPRTLAEQIPRQRATELATSFEEAGAEVRRQERTGYDIVLKTIGPSKVETARTIQEVTGLSLQEARQRSESLPSVLLEETTRQRAYQVFGALEEVGAKVMVLDRFAGS